VSRIIDGGDNRCTTVKMCAAYKVNIDHFLWGIVWVITLQERARLAMAPKSQKYRATQRLS